MYTLQIKEKLTKYDRDLKESVKLTFEYFNGNAYIILTTNKTAKYKIVHCCISINIKEKSLTLLSNENTLYNLPRVIYIRKI